MLPAFQQENGLNMKDNGINLKVCYYNELKDKQEIVKLLLEKSEEGTITLLYNSKEEKYNNAIALKDVLQSNYN